MFDILAVIAGLLITPAAAQNVTCPTRPGTDNSNACASTAFVHRSIGGMINVTDYGAVADSTGLFNGTDNLVAFQNATAAAIAQGKTLHISGANGKGFRISGAGWKLDYSTPISLYGTPHASIICDQDTVINFDNGDYHGLEVLGATDFSVGVTLPIQVSGCNFQKGDGLGDGISVNRVASILISNNLAQGWNHGINATDNLSSVYRENSLLFNNIGIQFQRGSFSYPNALGLYSNRIGGNNIAGIIANNPADFLVDNNDIEGNGGSGGAGHGGIVINGGPVEGGTGLILRNSHFEVNSGPADVAITATGAAGLGGAIHIINGTEFIRLSNSTFTTNNVLVTGTGPVNLLIDGTAFKGLGSYTPNAAHQYVVSTATFGNVCLGQNIYDSATEYTQLTCTKLGDWSIVGNLTATVLAAINVFTSSLFLNGSTSGAVIVQAPAVASGTVTLPNGTDTLVGRGTTDTLTNKTLTSPVLTGGGGGGARQVCVDNAGVLYPHAVGAC